MTTTTGTFRVYRTFAAVPHVNLVDVEADRLYSVYQSGYPEPIQGVVDDCTTGDLVNATLAGDPDDPDDPWRVESATPERSGSVTVDVATDVTYPEAAEATWATACERADDGQVSPAGRAFGPDGRAGELWVQPRDPLPDGAFARRLLTGLFPLEPWFRRLPEADEPAAELLALDSSTAGARRHHEPYGVLMFFTGTEAGRDLADRSRERFDLPREADSRPDFDPYA